MAPWGGPSARYPRGYPHNSREDPRFPSYIRGTFEQEIWKRYPFPEQEGERRVERARKERVSSKEVRFDEETVPDNEEFAGMWRHSFHRTKWSGAKLRDWVHVDEAERAAMRSSHQAVRRCLMTHAPGTRSGLVHKEVATRDDLMENYREPRFTFGRIREEVWNRKDVVPSVVFYAGIGGLSKGAILPRKEIFG